MRKHLLIPLVFLFTTSYAQEVPETEQEIIPEESQRMIDVKSFSFGVHGGTLSYIGDIKGNSDGSYFGFGNWAYGLSLEKKFGTNYGVLVNGIFGKVSKNETNTNTFVNFSSNIGHIDVNFMLDFDNGKSVFSPFLSVGLGFMFFNPKADLSAGGVQYNYWTDGTYRDIPQETPGSDTSSVVISRDYEYETELSGSSTAITVPVWAGLKFKLSRKMDMRLAIAYITTFTDDLDNISGGSNDKMFYTSLGLNYNFVGVDRSDKYRTIDFGSLFNADSDNDGVNDKQDLCQGTPEGVKVNSEGCPKDADKDGVPDYLDKEPNTPANTLVDSNGVAKKEEEIEPPAVLDEDVEIERKEFKSTDDNPK